MAFILVLVAIVLAFPAIEFYYKYYSIVLGVPRIGRKYAAQIRKIERNLPEDPVLAAKALQKEGVDAESAGLIAAALFWSYDFDVIESRLKQASNNQRRDVVYADGDDDIFESGRPEGDGPYHLDPTAEFRFGDPNIVILHK